MSSQKVKNKYRIPPIASRFFFFLLQAVSAFLQMSIINHTRLEIVGLKYLDNGRVCHLHPNGCGLALEVGHIITFRCVVAHFEEEHILITKKQEYKSFTISELKRILTDDYQVKRISNRNKEWLVKKLLEVRKEPDDDTKLTEIKRWSEHTAEVYTEDGMCKVGYISRHFMHMYPANILNGLFGKVLKLRSESEFASKRRESIRLGGSALVETVERVFN